MNKTDADTDPRTADELHKALHEHMDGCPGCATGPLNTCATGAALLEKWARKNAEESPSFSSVFGSGR